MDYYHRLNKLLLSGQEFVSITLVETSSSVPQDVGSKMLLTKKGIYFGSVGGGKLEARAIEIANSMLLDKEAQRNQLLKFNLNKDLQMTCGGIATLYFETGNKSNWNIKIFGSGHVANTLSARLSELPCDISVIDNRKEWLEKIIRKDNIKTIYSENLTEQVQYLEERDFVLLMTQGHNTDLPILKECLRLKLAYLGMIGSKAKRKSIEKELQKSNFSEEQIQSFYCPIGLPIGSHHLSEMTISIIAQLLQVRGQQ